MWHSPSRLWGQRASRPMKGGVARICCKPPPACGQDARRPHSQDGCATEHPLDSARLFVFILDLLSITPGRGRESAAAAAGGIGNCRAVARRPVSRDA